MKTHYSTLKSSATALVTTSLLLFTSNSLSAPGDLSDVPLQTSSSSEANIMFLLDDSGSMGNTNISPGYSRWDALEDSLDDIIPDLTGVNVGIASFSLPEDEDGGHIFYPLTLLDKSDTTNYNTRLNAILNTAKALDSNTYSGLGGNGTIPAEALQDVGRYFANGASGGCGADSGDADLTIHPGNATLEEDVSCSALLGNKATVIAESEAVTASCQKNFVILMSDGLTRKDYHLRSDGSDRFKTDPGVTSSDDSTAFTNGEHPFWDYDQDCTTIPDDDGDTNPDWTCGTSTSNQRDNKIGGTKNYSYDSNGTDYLDDVAQALYEIDLRPDYTDYSNNITTYTIGFSDSTLDPTSGSYNPLMESAALQGGGTYTYATDAASLTNAFRDITTSIIDQTSTSAAVTFNSSTLSNQSAVYLALFNTSRWGGELRSIPLDPSNGDVLVNCTDGSSNCWTATSQLEGQNHTADGQANDGRAILTYNAASNRGVAFRMPTGTDALFNASTNGTDQLANNFSQLDQSSTSTEIPLAMVEDLCEATNGSTHDCSSTDITVQINTQAFLEKITDYFRGDRSEEGTASTYQFRKRSSKLGDLVHSSPLFIGEPDWGWPTGGSFFPDDTAPAQAYSTWAASITRAPIVYVASNDGMLHGFRTEETSSGDGDAGEEVLAYIPTTIFSDSANEGMHYLADPTYAHKFYNDLTPIEADVFIHYKDSGGDLVDVDADTLNPINTPDMDPDDRAWRTVLLGGQRGGGRGMYLLDVTDPSKFTEATADEVVLWEFTHNDLGYSFSEPTIAMMNNGKFAAIFGNGYKSGEDGGSGDCRAKLFIVYLDGGLDGDWTDTGDYQVIDTGVGSVPNGTPNDGDDDNCNGLSTPVVADIDGNYTADRVYAGDLKGNLWAFDLCKHDGTACTTSGYSLAHATDPIMKAVDGSGNAQPITSAPDIAFHPTETGDHDLIVVFGTGQYINDADKATTGTQSIYAVRDLDALANGRAGGGSADGFNLDVPNPRSSNTSDFTVQTISLSGTNRTITDYSVANNDVGWMIDLPTSGERIVVDVIVQYGSVYFNTLIPNSATCTFGGDGWLMAVDLVNGGIPDEAIFDANSDGEVDSGDINLVGLKLDTIPSKSAFLGNYQYTSTSGGDIEKTKGKKPPEPGVNVGRMSWRELYDND